jgi:FtsP/CotA-like multicopper oxidase with cupredoxin domain
MKVVQSDGNDVEPVSVDEFRIGLAETYDVIVEPKDDTAYTIFAQAQDRTGYARATLAPRVGMTAEVPPMDPRPVRTMQDMGMSMAGMKMSGMKGMDMAGTKGMDMAVTKDTNKFGMKAMDMANMVMGDPTGTTPFPQPGPHTMPLSKTSYDIEPVMKVGLTPIFSSCLARSRDSKGTRSTSRDLPMLARFQVRPQSSIRSNQ